MRTMSCIFVIILLMAVSAQPDLTLYNATRNGAKVSVVCTLWIPTEILFLKPDYEAECKRAMD